MPSIELEAAPLSPVVDCRLRPLVDFTALFRVRRALFRGGSALASVRRPAGPVFTVAPMLPLPLISLIVFPGSR